MFYLVFKLLQYLRVDRVVEQLLDLMGAEQAGQLVRVQDTLGQEVAELVGI